MTLNREAILSHAGVLPTREVEIPAWGGSVLVRGLTVREFEVNQASIGKQEGKGNAAVIARCVVTDASGARLFEDSDVDMIAELPFKQVMLITDAINKLSGLTDDSDESEAKAEDGTDKSEPEPAEERGKEPPTPSGGSVSALHATSA